MVVQETAEVKKAILRETRKRRSSKNFLIVIFCYHRTSHSGIFEFLRSIFGICLCLRSSRSRHIAFLVMLGSIMSSMNPLSAVIIGFANLSVYSLVFCSISYKLIFLLGIEDRFFNLCTQTKLKKY